LLGPSIPALDDYTALAKTLSSIKSKFILSINDHPDMREVFKNFKIQPVSLLYSVGQKPKKAKELIITPSF
jgi:DNA adenine methylase